MPQLPFISVVVCTYKRPELLLNCLHGLCNQVFPNDNFEIIVTDDNEDNFTKDEVEKKFKKIIFVKGPHKGAPANRNNGAKHSKGKWLLFIDDDCIPAANWINAFSNAIIEYPTIKVFEGRTEADREKQRFDEESPINLLGGNLWSCNFAIERDFFFLLGGMSESYSVYWEDIDFQKRIIKKGEQIVFVKQAIVCHPWRQSRSIETRIKSLVNYEIFLKEHPEERLKINLLILLKNAVAFTVYSIPELIKLRFRGGVYMVKFSFFLFYRAFRIGVKLMLNIL
jgi:GT2 family glycosyltransferase